MNPPSPSRFLRLLLPGLLLTLACTPPVRADDLIRSVQEELRKRNLYFGDVDGVRSQQVAAALRRYQQRKGFPATGDTDETTLRSLSLAPAGLAAATPAFSPPAQMAEPAGMASAPWPDLPVLHSDQGREEPPPPGNEPADADLDPTPTPPPKPPPAASFQRQPDQMAAVRAFVEDFIRRGESNEPGAQTELFADRVNYFDDGVVDRHFISRDTDKYNKRWPDRHFTVVEPIQATELPDAPDRILVNFHCRIDVKRPGHDVKGETENTYTLQRTGPESLRIVGIKEQRVRGK